VGVVPQNGFAPPGFFPGVGGTTQKKIFVGLHFPPIFGSVFFFWEHEVFKKNHEIGKSNFDYEKNAAWKLADKGPSARNYSPNAFSVKKVPVFLVRKMTFVHLPTGSTAMVDRKSSSYRQRFRRDVQRV